MADDSSEQHDCDSFDTASGMRSHRSHHVRHDKSLSKTSSKTRKRQSPEPSSPQTAPPRSAAKVQRKASPSSSPEPSQATTLSHTDQPSFHSIFACILRYVACSSKLADTFSFENIPGDDDVDLEHWVNNTTVAEKYSVREVLWDNPDIISEYADDNPDDLGEKELEWVRNWRRYHVRKEFFILAHTPSGSVLLSNQSPGQAFYVHGISSKLSDLFGNHTLPAFVYTVLLPLEERIIFDGFAVPLAVSLQSPHKELLTGELKKYANNGTIVKRLDEHTYPQLSASSHLISPNAGREVIHTLVERADLVVKVAKRLEDESPAGKALSAAVVLVKAASLLKRILINDMDDKVQEKMISLERAMKRLQNH